MKPILYAEDDESDAALLRQIFEEVGVLNPIRIVPDGTHAIDYLSRAGIYADPLAHPTPGLRLLDLRLSDKRGIEVIPWVRGCRRWSICRSSSSRRRIKKNDIHRTNLIGAHVFFVKPTDPAELAGVVRALKGQWLDNFSGRTSFREISAFRAPPDGEKKLHQKNPPQALSQPAS